MPSRELDIQETWARDKYLRVTIQIVVETLRLINSRGEKAKNRTGNTKLKAEHRKRKP